MADRDPFILSRLADQRAASLAAAADRRRTVALSVPGWRRTAGLVLVRLGEVLAGDRPEPISPLSPAGAVR